MSLDSAGEARFEVVVAQAILNEVKYGVETNQLAEVSLLAAFQNRLVGSKLVEALQLLIPGLKYLSIGAILKDGVVVKTSNLAVEGPVHLNAKSLRGSAARVAARKLTAFHTKKRPDESRPKYYELQEAWDTVKATSVLTVPIPAVRRYESASITDDDIAPKNDIGASCHVLHSLSGAVGIVNFGLNTEDIHLEGRRGQAFQGMAHSLSPFLAYYAEPALQQLEEQIHSVAKANAANIAKTRAAQDDTYHHHHTPQYNFQVPPTSTAVPSPFSAAPPPSDSPRNSQDEVRYTSCPQLPHGGAHVTQGGMLHQQQQKSKAPNPFAQVANTGYNHNASHTASASGAKASKAADPPQQPISPFAAAAQMSKRLLSAQIRNPDRANSPSASRQDGASNSVATSPQLDGATLSEPAGSAMEQRSSGSSAESSIVGPPAHKRAEDANQLDASFVFKRKPVSDGHARRYSTTTFLQGVLHTPSQHFSHFKPMDHLKEDSSTEVTNTSSSISQSKEVTVDDHTYMSQFNRRALSTPEYHLNPDGSVPTLQQQLRTRSTCADTLLDVGPGVLRGSIDLGITDPQSHSKQHVQEQMQHMQGFISGQHVMHFSPPAKDAAVGHTAQQARQEQSAAQAAPSPSNAGSFPDPDQDQDRATARPASAESVKQQQDGKKGQHMLGVSNEEHVQSSQFVEAAAAKCQETVKSAVSASQHSFWLTFADPHLEAKYVAWFGRRVGKVDTVFMAFLLVYITQLLLFTWNLADQQTLKWPLFGYIVVPLLVLQHGDPSWYLASRPAILSGLRVALHAFLAYFVCHHPVETFKWLDTGGLGPLCIIPMGLMVQYKLHAILHTVACACVLIMGLTACPDDVSHNTLKCFTKTFPGVALASVMPSLVLYFVEAWHRKQFLRSQKIA